MSHAHATLHRCIFYKCHVFSISEGAPDSISWVMSDQNNRVIRYGRGPLAPVYVCVGENYPPQQPFPALPPPAPPYAPRDLPPPSPPFMPWVAPYPPTPSPPPPPSPPTPPSPPPSPPEMPPPPTPPSPPPPPYLEFVTELSGDGSLSSSGGNATATAGALRRLQSAVVGLGNPLTVGDLVDAL
eukprot:scaffold38048_cov63-Phaeocystis_antarctica.AAC.1